MEHGERLALSPPDRLPRLDGAWVRDSRRSGDRLTLDVEDLRRGPMVCAGEVVFTGVTAVETAYERPHDGLAPPTATRGEILRGRSAGGVTVLDMRLPTGPAEADGFSVTVHHHGVEARLRPSLSRTLRRTAGLYPRPTDFDRR